MEIESEFLKAYKYPSTLYANYQTPSMDDHQNSPLNNYYLQDFRHFDHHDHHFQAHHQGSSSSSNLDTINMIDGSDWSYTPLNSHDVTPKPACFVAPSYQEAVPFKTVENGFYKNVRAMNKSTNISSTRVSLTKKRTYKGQKSKTRPVKGQWRAEEDRLLIQLVNENGLRKWSYIAQMLPGRIGKQCRERWHNHLRPDIKKDTWSEEEDRVLISAHVEIGNKWAEIAKRLPGRTENSIKNHWNATKRRQNHSNTKRCRLTKCPKKPSLLQDYIKSLSLSPTKTTTSHQDQDHDDHGFDGELDFCFGKNTMFHEGYGAIDSLFGDHEKEVLMVDIPAEDQSKYDYQMVMKKELDLVEMISLVNYVG